MDQETHNNLEGFENINGSSTTTSPTLDNLVGLIATQNDLLRQLFQGQQTIPQLLQQQQHQLSGYPIHQPQIANYQEPNEETKEEKDIYLDSLLPPSQLLMKPREMETQNSKCSLVPIDLTGWEISCAEFIPRRQHQVVKTPDLDTAFRARTLSSIKEKMDQDRYPTHEDDSAGMPVMLPLDNNQPRGPSDTNRCFNCGSPSHFFRNCSRAKTQIQGQSPIQIPRNNSRKKKIEHRRQRKEHKGQ